MKLLYFLIFFSKVIENALATLRLIVVANGKKLMGAFLQLLVALVWVLVTGAVVVNIKEDPLKIVFFILGSFVGSYIGSIIEEKMALGSNMLMVVVNKNIENSITKEIRKNNFAVTVMNGKGIAEEKTILMIMVPRKKREKIVKIIKHFDQSALIISEVARTINGGYSDKESK